MALWETWSMAAAATWLMMTGAWFLSLKLKDCGIIDIFWGLGFVISAWVMVSTIDQPSDRAYLLAELVTLWGVRLALHIGIRNLSHEGEDKRYAAWRQEGGASWWWVSYFKVFLLQGLIMLFLLAPFALVISAPASPWMWWDGLGIVLWTVGFLFEAVGDWQLTRFKADPANSGKVMNRGLWRYSRYPNYFGESVLWWGFGAIALSIPGAFWALYAPAVMTFLLLKVSGVVLLEKLMVESRPDYRDYIASTPAFFPWLPKEITPAETE